MLQGVGNHGGDETRSSRRERNEGTLRRVVVTLDTNTRTQEARARDLLRFYTVYYEYLGSPNRGENSTRNYRIHMGIVGLCFH